MTKILSVEEVANDFGKQFDELKMKPPKNSMPGLERELLKDFMRKSLTEQRTALLTELREVITKKLTTRTYKVITQCEPNTIASITIPANQESAYNLGSTITLKDLQAHLDELIKSTK